MRRCLIALVLLGCQESQAPQSADAGRAFKLEPAPSVPAPALPPVAGAAAESGAVLFGKLCASCHGASGDGAPAVKGPIAPTDLGGPGFLCFSTAGTPPVP